MSKWTHVLCARCYDKRQPGRQPHRPVASDATKCCSCGEPSADIPYREDPATIACYGRGANHDDE